MYSIQSFLQKNTPKILAAAEDHYCFFVFEGRFFFFTETCLTGLTVSSLWQYGAITKRRTLFWKRQIFQMNVKMLWLRSHDFGLILKNLSSITAQPLTWLLVVKQQLCVCVCACLCVYVWEYTCEWEEEEWHRYTEYSRWVWRGRRWRGGTFETAWQHKRYKGAHPADGFS